MTASKRNPHEVNTRANPDPGTSMPGHTGWNEETGETWSSPERERRWEIILAYLRALEGMTDCVAVESDLPYSKEVIRRAILEELREGQNMDLWNYLEIAYVQLEAFIPYEEYRVIADFKYTSEIAMEMAFSGDPTSIIRSAQLIKRVKGDWAIRIQEKIYENMLQSQQQVHELQMQANALEPSLNDSLFNCTQ